LLLFLLQLVLFFLNCIIAAEGAGSCFSPIVVVSLYCSRVSCSSREILKSLPLLCWLYCCCHDIQSNHMACYFLFGWRYVLFSLSSCLIVFGLATRHVQRLLYITWTIVFKTSSVAGPVQGPGFGFWLGQFLFFKKFKTASF
jgi:hypothetical protein